MFPKALVIGSLLALALASCTETVKPASTAGECHVFHDPGFPVQGKRVKDQRWVSKSQESGIKVCGWPRPKAETPESIVTVKPSV